MNILALLLVMQGAYSPPTFEARPSSSNVSVGERFQVTLEAHGPVGAIYTFPKTVSTGAVELTPSARAGQAESFTYDAQVFALGDDAQIPEIEVAFTMPDGAAGTAKSAPVRLNVVSSLDPQEENPAPADFSPPVPIFVSRAFWVASSIAGLLLIALLVWLFRRLRFPKKASDPTVTQPLSPEEDALNALDKLVAARGRTEPKAFYIQLVQILKNFLERRLGAPVLEMTSTETLIFVKGHSWTGPHALPVRDLITAADLVKFGGSSDASNADRQIQVVREIIGRVDRLRRAELELQSREIDRRKSA